MTIAAIVKLRGGTILRTGPGGDVSITPHRPLIERLRDTEVPLAGALENMHGAIGHALAMLTGHGTPVTDLTGGNDSRALAAALLSHGHPFVSTVTGPDDRPLYHRVRDRSHAHMIYFGSPEEPRSLGGTDERII